MSKKKTLVVYISEDTYKELIVKAPEIYGKVKGAISYAVEVALRKFLGLESETPGTHTLTHTHKPVDLVYSKILNTLKAKYGFIPNEITESDLDAAIGATRGLDQRTIKKWKEQLIVNKCVEVIAVSPSGRVFKVNSRCGGT